MPNKDIILSPFAREILNDARLIATTMCHEFVMPEHFIMAACRLCIENDTNNPFLNDFKFIADQTQEIVLELVPRSEECTEPSLSILMNKAIKEAIKIVQHEGDVPVPATAIIIAIINTPDNLCNSVISNNISDKKLSEMLTYLMSIDGQSLRGYDVENNINWDNTSTYDASSTEWMKYITDLNPLRGNNAKAIIGRNNEMNRLAQALCRCNKNNALIVGESGVGKSAIVKGFVVKLESFPSKISKLPVYELSIPSVLANAQYHGEIEQRITSVMNGIKALGGGIIVIDDIHSLVGSKGDANGSRDLTGLFMQYLDDENLRFIGITTFEDITRHLDSHSRFLRRFRRIDVEEPTQQETIEILTGVKNKYEKYHNIRISPGVIDRIVKLSKRFLSGKALPDSAIDILDEAGAYRELNPIQGNKKQTINKDLIDSIVAQLGNVKTKIIDDNDTTPLRNLEKNMRNNIFGQDEAIKQVVEAVLTARAGLTDEHKPQSSLLFVGPTGVGKTEVARVVSNELGIPLHKFDMSEYSERYSVSKLIGSSPGYVGYEEGGRLTEAVRKNPHCVLLLDEIEKAHEKVFDTLLQVMDYASLTDSRGRKVDFSHVILIMTSNSGAQFAKQAGVGFGSTVTTGQAMLSEVKKTFKPEFINRLSSIVVFNDMNLDMARLILDKKISELNTRLNERNIEITLTNDAREWLLKNGFSAKYGAREIERVITHNLKPLLVKEILFGKLSKKSKGVAEISISNDQLSLTLKK